jgi:hypothetical protein
MAEHIVQVSINIPRVMRFYKRFWGHRSPGLSDVGMLIKTALTETFVGEAAIRPWRQQGEGDEFGTLTILGVSKYDAEQLKDMVVDSLPELANCYDTNSFFSKPLRDFEAGKRYQIQSLVSARKMTSFVGGKYVERRVERDLYSIEKEFCEAKGKTPRSREEVYTDFFQDFFEDTVEFESCKIKSIKSDRTVRKDENGLPNIAFSSNSAEFEATVKIKDAECFRNLLINGIGRAKAYGHGMVLVRAAA